MQQGVLDLSKQGFNWDKFLSAEPQELKTGNTDAHTGTALLFASGFLGCCGYSTIETLTDRIGSYCTIMLSREGQKIFLIAKNSAVWNDTVSCQAFLPDRVAKEKSILLLALSIEPRTDFSNVEGGEELADSFVEFYLFNPEAILAENLGFNERKGVKFINWKFSSGLPFYPKKSDLSESISILHKRGFQTQMKGHL